MARALVVIIATAGRSQLLDRTLRSLTACHKPDIYGATIVVENGPQAGAEEIVREHESALNARYMYVPKSNKSNALNIALETIGDSLVFFTDDDIRYHRDTLCAYAHAAGDVQGGWFYGGAVGVDYEREPPQWLLRYLPYGARGWDLDGELQIVQEPIFLGCNWAAFTVDLKRVGKFDIQRGAGAATGAVGEEKEMQVRLLASGIKGVYIPTAMVWHYVPAERCSPKWALKKAYRHGVRQGLDFETKTSTVLGYPRPIVRRILRVALKALVKSASGDLKTRFGSYSELCILWGHIRGIHARRNAFR